MQKGFTLIELMIVIAIIGILAAIALPAYQDYIARSQVTEALSLASGQKAAVAEYYSSKNACPKNSDPNNAATGGLAKPSLIAGKYVEKVEVDEDTSVTITVGNTTIKSVCGIVATMKSSDISQGIQGKKLGLYMAPTSGAFAWQCGSGDTDLDDKYLPSSCQKQ